MVKLVAGKQFWCCLTVKYYENGMCFSAIALAVCLLRLLGGVRVYICSCSNIEYSYNSVPSFQLTRIVLTKLVYIVSCVSLLALLQLMIKCSSRSFLYTYGPLIL